MMVVVDALHEHHTEFDEIQESVSGQAKTFGRGHVLDDPKLKDIFVGHTILLDK